MVAPSLKTILNLQMENTNSKDPLLHPQCAKGELQILGTLKKLT